MIQWLMNPTLPQAIVVVGIVWAGVYVWAQWYSYESSEEEEVKKSI